jgi:hypothetical protein
MLSTWTQVFTPFDKRGEEKFAGIAAGEIPPYPHFLKGEQHNMQSFPCTRSFVNNLQVSDNRSQTISVRAQGRVHREEHHGSLIEILSSEAGE